MSKAKALGAGRFGSPTAAPVSARRQAVAAATGVPTEGVAPPTKLPVDQISLNPDNPRSTLGDLTELAGSLKEHGQKQAITVMNRDAYVKANPARETELEPHATHIVIDGSSRLAAAREAGLTHLKVWVDDEQGHDSEALLESALVANIHRQDLAELDEARALQRLLAIHGSQSTLAKRLHKSQGWVSQRLALLSLTPELQAKIGQEPIKLLRAVGNKPADQQAAALEELKRKHGTQSAGTKQAPGSGDSGSAGTYYPVMASDSSRGAVQPSEARLAADDRPTPTGSLEQAPGAGDSPHAPAPLTGRPADPGTAAGPSLPAQTAAPAPGPVEERQPQRFPYENGFAAAQHLIVKMPPQQLDRLADLLLEHRNKRTADAR